MYRPPSPRPRHPILTNKGPGQAILLFDQYPCKLFKYLKAVIIKVRNYNPAGTQHRQEQKVLIIQVYFLP